MAQGPIPATQLIVIFSLEVPEIQNIHNNIVRGEGRGLCTNFVLIRRSVLFHPSILYMYVGQVRTIYPDMAESLIIRPGPPMTSTIAEIYFSLFSPCRNIIFELETHESV